MGRYSDSIQEPDRLPHQAPLSAEIKQSLLWFYGSLSEAERIAEWLDWEARQKRFHRPQWSADYVQFCIQPMKYIHQQWVHRNRPML